MDDLPRARLDAARRVSRSATARPTFAARGVRVTIDSFGANVSVTSTVSVRPTESVTVSFTGNEPGVDGVPLRRPVAASSETPTGRFAPLSMARS